MSLTAEQLDLRRTGIGASEAAAACGLSPWTQTAELYLRKIGQSDPVTETRDMLFGRHMEAGGIAYWSALRGRDIMRYPLPTVRHAEHAFILATGDAQLSATEGLEFKTMSDWRFRDVEKNGIADAAPEYVLQAQQQMLVMDWERVTIAVMVGKDLHDIEVERNERLQGIIIEREAMFWDHVERRDPPGIDFSREDALRCVQALYPEVKTNAVVQLPDELCAAWSEYESAGKQIRDLESLRKSAKALLLSAIRENFGGVLGDGRMVRRKWVEPTSYTVEREGFFDVRAVKYDGSTILGLPEPDQAATTGGDA